ncbi:MAG TPA: CocE/NonD family hydrolase [Acidimicrobiales bacterium]|nr:CocE/NonD family hydrolase [Acidimicrobiales bacterium]
MSVLSRIIGTAARLPRPSSTEVAVERDLQTKMPDGAVLLADRWYPSQTTSLPPTVLLRSPYGRRQLGLLGRLFAERGYQAVIQSCRGTFGSGGEWLPMRNEPADGAATLEWIAAQPWFDGRLVTFGPSYLGITQWAVAESPPDLLKAMALNVTASGIRDAIIYPGDAFALETALTWMFQVDNQEGGALHVLRTMARARKVVTDACMRLPLGQCDRLLVGRSERFYQDWLAHEAAGDEWWDVLDFKRREAVPAATLVGGWYDLFLSGQVKDFVELRRAGRTVRLTVGPWTHASLGAMGVVLRDALEFFDEQLNGARPRRGRVRLYVMGTGRWEEYDEWPPPADAQPWYLGSGGTLSRHEPPGGGARPSTYRYDPADPTPAAGGASLLGASAGPKDQSPRESRRDVLTYTSGVMTEDMKVIGPLTVTLHVRSTLEHTDFMVRLCDVDEKGKSVNLSDGLVRVGPGVAAGIGPASAPPDAGPVTRSADGTLRLQISMWPTANTFKKGHRVRLQVSSGAHPLFARNPGTGEPLATASTLRAADQEIWHDDAHPSCVTLPVVLLSKG